MTDATAIQALFEPLLPGLMGLTLTQATPERVTATMQVRPDLCTSGGISQGTTVSGACTPFDRGRTTMVWQTLVRIEAGKLCAVVTQTQLVIPG
jgi:1,4-dihydroxy-2-naphthoyl-CoA hydrolase